jgi:hypothetical protein
MRNSASMRTGRLGRSGFCLSCACVACETEPLANYGCMNILVPFVVLAIGVVHLFSATIVLAGTLGDGNGSRGLHMEDWFAVQCAAPVPPRIRSTKKTTCVWFSLLGSNAVPGLFPLSKQRTVRLQPTP